MSDFLHQDNVTPPVGMAGRRREETLNVRDQTSHDMKIVGVEGNGMNVRQGNRIGWVQLKLR